MNIEKDTVIRVVTQILKLFKELVYFPVPSTMIKIIKVHIVILIVTVLARLLNLYTFISWQGVLLSLTLVTIQVLIERREELALTRINSHVAILRRKVKSASARSSSSTGKPRSVQHSGTSK